MGSIAQDKMGNIALGYSKSGEDMYPSIYVTGHVPADPLGQMEEEVERWTVADRADFLQVQRLPLNFDSRHAARQALVCADVVFPVPVVARTAGQLPRT